MRNPLFPNNTNHFYGEDSDRGGFRMTKYTWSLLNEFQTSSERSSLVRNFHLDKKYLSELNSQLTSS
jgi:hypothetical protein